MRVSVWDATGTARAAISLDEEETARLSAYLAPPPSARRQGLFDDLRALVGR